MCPRSRGAAAVSCPVVADAVELGGSKRQRRPAAAAARQLGNPRPCVGTAFAGPSAEALPFIPDAARSRARCAELLAHESVAARLMGRSLYQDLYNYEAFVRACG